MSGTHTTKALEALQGVATGMMAPKRVRRASHRVQQFDGETTREDVMPGIMAEARVCFGQPTLSTSAHPLACITCNGAHMELERMGWHGAAGVLLFIRCKQGMAQHQGRVRQGWGMG